MTDFAAGDLVVCVDDTRAVGLLHIDAVYIVSGICEGGASLLRETALAPFGLLLVGKRANSQTGGFDPARFVKIKPDTAEACDAEFVTVYLKKRVTA